MPDADYVKLATTRPDVEVAADLRRRLEVAASPVLAILEEANAARFVVSLGLERDAFGQLRFKFHIVREF